MKNIINSSNVVVMTVIIAVTVIITTGIISIENVSSKEVDQLKEKVELLSKEVNRLSENESHIITIATMAVTESGMNIGHREPASGAKFDETWSYFLNKIDRDTREKVLNNFENME